MNPWVERLGWTLLHFVWQGGLIAGLYAAGRRALKTGGPNARYLLACAAMAAMVAAPAVTPAVLSGSPVRVPSGASLVGDAGHFSGEAAASGSQVISIASDATGSTAMVWVVLFWLAGASLFCIRLMGGWWMTLRIRSCGVRDAPAEWREAFAGIGACIGVLRPVRLLVSALVRVPTVVGWLRPVVLVPVGALAGLPPEHVEALLAHELAHIRRHDYLVNILQSVAEALLFYHPAVWWVSGHMRSERELCCDDIAVLASGDAFLYANALADLESLRSDRLDVAMAGNGGLLGNRIARLLGHERTNTRPGPGVIVSAILLVVAACSVLGQTNARPRFEVASIKPSMPGARPNGTFILPGGERYTGSNVYLKFLIQDAWRMHRDQITGGPDWVTSDLYDLNLKAEKPSRTEAMRVMLQSLIVDRFNLQFHVETVTGPVYALVVDRSNSPKLLRHDAAYANEPFAWQQGAANQQLKIGWHATSASMEYLAWQLSSVVYGPVIDRTGLPGAYDFDLAFTMGWPPSEPEGTLINGLPVDTTGPTVFEAIRKLGLRLERQTGPVEFMRIDHVERPSGN